MADNVSKEKRSWNMSRIKSKDTAPELKIRSYLFKEGFRFRKNVSDMPGKPDIVLPKYHTVVFVNGCFWHRHKDCRYAYNPKSRVEFWQKKFNSNVANDIKNRLLLESEGWYVLTVWECEIRHHFDDVKLILKESILKNIGS